MTDRITRTYRGRPGCGCGCRGTYSDHPATVTRRLREAAEAVRAGERPELTDAGPGDGFCVSLESEARYLWLYFADRASAERFVGAALMGAPAWLRDAA